MFITFEGGEGVGKSTLINSLVKKLDKLKITYITTREPGGTKKSEEVREILLNNQNLSNDIRADLFVEARKDHNLKVIKPALRQKKIVLCDRYYDSTFIYQGLMSSPEDFEMVINKNISSSIEIPDITFILDLDPLIAQTRMKLNNREVNYLDNLPIEHHQKIRDNYLKLEELKNNNHYEIFKKTKIVILDATKETSELTNIILNYML